VARLIATATMIQVLALFVISMLSLSWAGIPGTSTMGTLLGLRGGLVPQADEDGKNYYEKFELDYGSDDTRRNAGAMRGFLPPGRLSALPESDPFLKWWNEYLEKGPAEELTGRLKPFYAADFGDKAELKKGEHPKVIIVQRKLKTDKNGILVPASKDVDVEIREIWQPWLRRRCNFAVRYVVPSRVNIIKIMEAKGRFHSVLQIDKEQGHATDASKGTSWAKMIFKPSLQERLVGGKRTVEVKRRLDSSFLFSASKGKVGDKAGKRTGHK
jgi:hypothetical protein